MDGDLWDLETVTFDAYDGISPQKTWLFTYDIDRAWPLGAREARGPIREITSPNGQIVLRNDYEALGYQSVRQDSVIRQVRAGDTYDFAYTGYTPSGQGDNRSLYATIVVNRLGQVKLLGFDANGRSLVERHDFAFAANPATRAQFLDQIRNPNGLFVFALLDCKNGNLDASLLAPYVTLSRGTSAPLVYSTGSTIHNVTARPTLQKLPNGDTVSLAYQSVSGTNPMGWGNVVSQTRVPYVAPGNPPAESITELWEYAASLGGGCGCGSSFATKHIDGEGNVTLWDRNDFGDPHTITRKNAQGVTLSVESFSYDSQGRMLTHIYPDNNNGGLIRTDTNVYYSDSDSLAGRRGKLHQFIADSAGLALMTIYDYDDLGNLASMTDAKGHITSYIYNGRGLLASRIDPIVNIGESFFRRYRTDFVYDRNDQLVRVDSRIVLDAAGNQIFEPSAGSEPVRTTIHEYDAIGRRTRTCQEVYGEIDPDASQLNCTGFGATNPVDLTTVAPSPSGERYFVTTEYEYDANDHVVLVRSGEATSGAQPGNIVSRVYDERNLLFLETRGTAGTVSSTTRLDYDTNMNLLTRLEGYGSPAQRATSYVYDGHDRLTKIIDPMNNRVEYTYDKNHNRKSEQRFGPATDGGVIVELAHTESVYDGLDRMVDSRVRLFAPPAGSTPSDPVARTTREYNADSSVRSISAYRSASTPDTTLYTYDLLGRTKSVTDPLGNKVEYVYDDNSNVTQVTSIEKRADPLGGPSQIEERFVSTSDYDELDRPVMTTDGVGNQTRYRYDAAGNAIFMKDARWNETTYAYDGLNRLTQTKRMMVAGGVGAAPGQPAPSSTLITTSQIWDASSRLIAQIDDNANATRYGYDELNRLRVTRFGDGTLSAVGVPPSWPAGALRPTPGGTNGYDSVGNPTQLRDANGNVVNSTFDALSRVTARSISRGADIIGTTAEFYTYDGLSRLLEAIDDDTRVQRTYDSLSRITTEISSMRATPSSSWADAKTVAYSYDLMGNITQLTYPSGRIVSQEFDSLSRIAQINSSPIGGGAAAMHAQYTYAGPGRVDRRAYANGTETLYGYSGIQNIANATGDFGFGRIAQVTHRTSGATPVNFDARTVAWDKAQNKTSFKVDGSDPITRSFEYDSASRLVVSKRKPDSWPNAAVLATYTLDGVHNRSDVTGSLESGAQIGSYVISPFSPGFDYPVNQYTTTPVSRISYDENGNLTRYEAQASGGMSLDLMMGPGLGPQSVRASAAEAIAAGGQPLDMTADEAVTGDDVDVMVQLASRGGGGGGPGGGGEMPPGAPRAATLRYDYRNQMVEYADDEDIPAAHSYAYDCLGRRVVKRIAGGNLQNVRFVSGQNTHGAASWQTIEEYNESLQTLRASYVHGNYIDEVLSMRKPAIGPTPAQEYYFHADDLFNVVAVTSAAGVVIERYDYGDYGAPTIMDAGGVALGASTVGNPRLFNGREWDAEIAFYYYRTRYMEPTMGRFTTRDSIGVWGDAANHGSALAYVGSGPGDGKDPFGDVGGEEWRRYERENHPPRGLTPPQIRQSSGCTVELRCRGVAGGASHCFAVSKDGNGSSTEYRAGPRDNSFSSSHETGRDPCGCGNKGQINPWGPIVPYVGPHGPNATPSGGPSPDWVPHETDLTHRNTIVPGRRVVNWPIVSHASSIRLAAIVFPTVLGFASRPTATPQSAKRFAIAGRVSPSPRTRQDGDSPSYHDQRKDIIGYPAGVDAVG